VAEGIDLKLDGMERITEDQLGPKITMDMLPAEKAELDDVDRRMLDDQNRATQFAMAGAGARGNTRAIAAGQNSLAQMREGVVRAARDRSIAERDKTWGRLTSERDALYGRLSGERDKAFERSYGEQTWEHGHQANAASQLFTANLAARGGAIDQILARGDARAAREGAQAGQRASAAGTLTGALMGAASSFGGGNGGWSWGGGSTPSGPGQGGNAGPGQGGNAGSVGSGVSGVSSFLSNIFNTAANSRKIASQPSPTVTTRPAFNGAQWVSRV
jgi:hypothetical protein